MKIFTGSTICIAAIGLAGGMGLSLPAAAEEHATSSATHQMTPKFPKSDKCSTSSPCSMSSGICEIWWARANDER